MCKYYFWVWNFNFLVPKKLFSSPRFPFVDEILKTNFSQENSCVLDNAAISTGNHSVFSAKKIFLQHVKERKGKAEKFSFFSLRLEWRKAIFSAFSALFARNDFL